MSRLSISRIRVAGKTRSMASRYSAPALRRSYATEGPNTSGKPQTQAGAFYKSFGSPILKCFLGALFTYQVTYWGWMKLEAVEEQHDTEEEIKGLKEELKALVLKKMEAEQAAAAEQQQAKVKEEKPVKKGWW